MKERPILFNGDMVRAILDGRKSQTRRVVKIPKGWSPKSPDGSSLVLGEITSSHPKKGKFGLFITRTNDGFVQNDIVPCPYGQPGDRLWVRETTQMDDGRSNTATLSQYAADGEPVLYSGCEDPEYNGSIAHWNYFRDSRPSIHMPRWASRITLEITNVRVERLQDISRENAEREGFSGGRGHFTDTWIGIYGRESLDANPWVWVVEFKRITNN